MGGESSDCVLQLLLLAAEEHRLGQLPLVLRDGRISFELLRVHQRQIEPRLHAVIEEDGIHHLASGRGQPERHVGDAEHGLAGGQRGLHRAHGFDRLHRAAGVRRVAGRAGEDERVEVQILLGDAVLPREQLVAASRHRELVRRLDRLSALVDAADDQRGAVTPGDGDDLLEALLAVLEIDRVDDRLALRVRERRLDGLLVRRVDHQRHADLLDQDLEEAAQVGHLVAVGLLRRDVDYVRASLHLRASDFRRLVPLLLRDQVAELLRAEHVGALADDDGSHVVGDLQRVHPGEGAAPPRRDDARLQAWSDLREPGDVAAVRSAAAAHQVEPAVLAEAPEGPRQHLGSLEVLAALVGQSRVRDAGHSRSGELRERADVIGHELRTRRTVEPEVEELDVLERDRQRVDRLARQHGAHRLDGAAHRDGHPLPGRKAALEPIDADQTGLHVAGVLRRLQQEVVDAAFVQAVRLGLVMLDQLLEGHSAGDGDRLGGRSHRTGHETRFVARRTSICFRARQRRRGPVDLDGALVQAVLGEDERRAAEGVGLEDVRTGLEIAAMHPADDFRTRHVQDLVAALQVGAAEVFG